VRQVRYTKQGVRDLDHLPSKAGRRLDPIPEAAQVCKHTNIKTIHLTGDTVCLKCSTMWDWHGEEY
jgi:hypothetical protein